MTGAYCRGVFEATAIVDRLAAIEDILGDDYDLYRLRELLNICNGKTSNQVERIFEEWSHYLEFAGKMNAIAGAVDTIYDDGNVDYDRLRELVEADKDGRCVVLQKEPVLKKGDRVWYVDRENGELESGTVFLAAYKDGKLDSFSVDFDCGDFDEFSGVAWGKHFFGSEKVAKIALAEVD